MPIVSENPYLKIDKEIVSEVYTSWEPLENLRILCDNYGSRFPGTPEDFGSINWMVEKLKEYGLENVCYEPFKFLGWIRSPSRLEVLSPIKKELESISLPMGPAGEVEGRLVFLGDGPLDIYERRRKDIEGNIVMVTSRNPLGMVRHLHRTEKFMRSILAGAKGWIFMNHNPACGPITGSVSPIIPSVGISYEDGRFLIRLLEKESEVKLRIKTSDRHGEATSYNVFGDIPGSLDDHEYVLTGSHYDGHDISQGAVDSASGVVTVLEMARILNIVRDGVKRRIRFVCFGAEEIGLFGSTSYVAKHEGEMDSLRFMLNLDAVGGMGRKGIILHGNPELEAFIEGAAREMRSELPYLQRVSPYSDHWPFFLKGVPSGSGGDPEGSILSRIPLLSGGFGHTRYDTVDKVELESLRLAIANYSRLLLRVANATNWPAIRKTKSEIDEVVREHGYWETVRLVEKVKEYVGTWKELYPETKAWLERSSYW
ncbi:MAG: M28 family peptidase [Candidatus Bathyarchaeia archaeon]